MEPEDRIWDRAKKYASFKWAQAVAARDRLRRWSASFLCCNTAADVAGVLLGVLFFILLFYILFEIIALLYPQCAVSPEGRVCNDRGSCVEGLCRCDTLYSGEACTETAVPGYLLGTNKECNGNGEANPFIQVPEECFQTINSRGQRVGPGWADPGCIEYLRNIQEQLDETGGNPIEIPAAVQVPMCVCRIPFTGRACDRNGCPASLNGVTCGGHGNSSVGLIQNGTTTGEGCQCQRLTGFFEEPYAGSFTPEARTEITNSYYTLFNQLYCGTILISASDPDIQFLWQQDDDYKCFCTNDWKGTACTEGKCPVNPQTEAVCFNNGHPALGFGYDPNSVFTINEQNKTCAPRCTEGYRLCGKRIGDTLQQFRTTQEARCVIEQDTLLPRFSESQYCDTPERCPDAKPIRCSQGSCVRLPEEAQHGCENGYATGVWDWAQLNRSLEVWKCGNLTNTDRVTACFQNFTGPVPGILGLAEQEAELGTLGVGGVVTNGTEVTVDLGGGPLFFFSVQVSQAQGQQAVVTTWDGQRVVSDVFPTNGPHLFSGGFNYDTETLINATFQRTPENVTLTPYLTDKYNIGPVTEANFSGEVLFPANYTAVRLINAEKNLSYAFDTIGSNLTLTASFNGDLLNSSVVFAGSSDGEGGSVLFALTGEAVLPSICEGNPPLCAWYVEDDQLRSLEEPFIYVCGDTGTVVTQTAPCPTSFFTWAPTLVFPERIQMGQLFLTALSRVEISEEHLQVPFQLDRNTTHSNAFSLVFQTENATFLQPEDNSTFITPILQSLAFLTQDRLQVPCACDLPSVLMPNMSTWNENWWAQTTRRPQTALSVGQHVLASDSGAVRGGDLYLRRGWVVAADPVAQTAQIQALKGENSLFSQYWRELREISIPEFLKGWDDCNQTALPMRCPDGTCSRLEAVQRDVPTSCNCTYTASEFNNAACSCLDEAGFGFGCSCTDEFCQCGQPATPEFEGELFTSLGDRVLQGGCSCEVQKVPFEPNPITSQTQVGEGLLNFTFNQQPVRYIVVERTNCTAGNLTVSARASQFSDSFEEVSFWVDPQEQGNCTVWVIPDLDPAIPYDEVRVEGDSVTRGTVYLSLRGYMLTTTQATASSNVETATNIFTNNNTWWESSGSLREAPVWVEMRFLDQAVVAEQVLVDFYTAASLNGFNQTVLPRRVYLFGSNNGQHWYHLDSYNVSVVEGAQVHTSLFLPQIIPFDRYRLAMENGHLGVRRWEIYSGQICECVAGGELSLSLGDLAGLKTTQDWLNSIQFELNSLDPDLPCVAVNNCTIQLLPGEPADVSQDGVCEDVIYVAEQLGVLGVTELSTTLTESFRDRLFVNYTTEVFGNSTIQVQLANSTSEWLDQAEMAEAYVNYQGTGSVIPIFSNSSTLVIFFLLPDNSTLEPFSIQSELLTQTYSSKVLTSLFFEEVYGSLIEQGLACPAGWDVTDCGPSSRTVSLLPNVNCTLNETAQNYRNAELNRTTVGVTNTIRLSNLTEQLTSNWTAYFTNMPLVRVESSLSLLDCGGQVCPASTPVRCDSGQCVSFPSQCSGDRYVCPGNGCVKMSGASEFEAFGCACEPYFGGLDCSIGDAIPATPRNQFRVPIGGEIACGQPPPLREKPPFVDLLPTEPNTIDTLLEINNRQTGNSAPLSNLDVAYLRVMPQAAPWGKPLQWCYSGDDSSSVLSFQARRVCTTCPPARRGSRGEYVLLDDDVLSRDPTTGEVTAWRPDVDGNIHPWSSIIAYNDFPYRCRNGACVAEEKDCVRAELLYPVCNSRGRCRADGSCLCDPGWRSFSITEQFTEKMQWPYAYSEQFGGPDPTIWQINFNWRDYGQNWCTARDCTVVDCTAPSQCYPGSPELQFADRLVECRASTGVGGKCGRNQQACEEQLDLQDPLLCAGNGIPRLKDFTGEEYCACGDPVSETAVIQNLTSIAQLKKNGWGGTACGQYFAPVTESPLVWSTWNWALNEPWRSAVTGEDLPGKWVGWGTLPIGADPDDTIVWEQCCDPGIYPRLESCPFVPCRIEGQIVCRDADECGPGSGEVPLVYYCNNHGTPRADSTCECERDDREGEGYTFDLDQFSEKGCFRRVRCEQSRLTEIPCNFIEPCTNPRQWRHPLPAEPYWNQNWLLCCLDGLGEYTNLTLMNTINRNEPNFQQQLIEAGTTNALLVIEAEAALQGCVCVYPDDTATEKTGMVAGADLTYEQNFKAAYEILLTPQNSTADSKLVNNLLFSTLGTPFSTVFSAGQNLTFFFPREYSIQAVRLFNYASGDASVRFLNSDGETACPVLEDFDSILALMDWDTQFCGNEYTCKNFRTEADYAVNCGVDVNSAQCVAWKEETCNAQVGAQYWPPDSEDIFRGCERTQDIDGCVCCVGDPFFSNPPTNSITIIIDQGEVELGEVRVYGYANSTEPVSATLQQYIDSVATPSECHDFAFFQAFLGPDRTFYAPLDPGESTQQPQNKTKAEERCQETGGWLATPTDLNAAVEDGLEYAPGFAEMNRVCQGLPGEGDKRCWVDAENREYTATEYLTRDDFFTTGCQEYGCWHENPLPPLPGKNPLVTFLSMQSATNIYQAKVFPDQIDSYQFVQSYNSFAQTSFQNFFFPVTANPDLFGITRCNLYLAKNCLVDQTACQSEVFISTLLTNETLVIRQRNPIPGASGGFFVQRPSAKTTVYVEDLLKNGYTNWATVPPDCADFRATPAVSDLSTTDPSGRQGFVVTALSCKQQRALTGSVKWCFFTDLRVVRQKYFNVYFAGGAYEVRTTIRSWTLEGEGSTGEVGTDFILGMPDYRYMPIFMDAVIVRTWATQQNLDFHQGVKLAQFSVPVYAKQLFTLFASFGEKVATFSPGPPRCTSCFIPLNSFQTAYDRRTFSTLSSWPINTFTPPNPPFLNVQRPQGWERLIELQTTEPQLFTHQVVFIEDFQEDLAVPWEVDACGAAAPEGYTSSVCRQAELNFVCQYDFTKYTVLTGYQCDKCGPSTRIGGRDLPGQTCFTQFPLANATTFPELHRLAFSYRQGTMDLYVNSFNFLEQEGQDGTDPFSGVATFPGCPLAWQRWVNSESTRQQSTSRGSLPLLNWCDMNLVDTYPVNCGLRRNQTTGVKRYYCAAEEELCPLNVELPLVEVSDIPPIYSPVDPSESTTDPTCGPNVPLRTYFETDKFGALQTNLLNHQNVLELEPSYIKVEVTGLQEFVKPSWFNGGKAPARYVFEANKTATISGNIQVLCETCAGAVTLTVFIHTIDPLLYSVPTTRIENTAAVPLLDGSTVAYSLEFTPTELDVGQITVAGQQFPLNVFRGVGFELTGLTQGSSYTLFNPVITDEITRQECENRTQPTFYEPLGRTESKVPENQCVISEEDQDRFDNQEIGTCACGLPFAGSACDCPALADSKYGKKVCGGVGDSLASVLPPDNSEVQITGDLQNQGCYIYGERSQCKCIQVGTAAWTLQYSPSLWDWPRVFVEAAPVRGARLFTLAVSAGWAEKDDIEVQCVLQTAGTLPYAIAGGEYTALAEEFQTALPVFLDMSYDGTGFLWDTPGIYFSQEDGNSITFPCPISTLATTLQNEACRTLNHNNFAFLQSGDKFTDGDTTTAVSSAATGQIELLPSAPFNVRVLVWPVTSISAPTITAPNGVCGTVTLVGNAWQAVCRTGDRIIEASWSMIDEVSEIQVFAEEDLSRSTGYAYS